MKWLLSRRQEIASIVEDVAKRKPLCTIGGNGAAIMEKSREIPEKLKIGLPYDSAISFWVLIQRTLKH